MKIDLKLLLLFLIIGCALAYPRTRNIRQNRRTGQVSRYRTVQFVRPRRAPIHRAMLIGSIYRPHRTLLRRQGFEPDAAMTAYAAGDTVSAGSYLGSNCVTCDQPLVEQDAPELGVIPEADPIQFEPERPAADFPAADFPAEPAPLVPSGPLTDEPITSQRRPNKLAAPEDDDDDDEVVPKKTKYGTRTYFPINLGYPGSARSGGGSGGGVTAIANSYSTGKGGVATSHATAYGGAPPRSKKGAVEDDDD